MKNRFKNIITFSVITAISMTFMSGCSSKTTSGDKNVINISAAASLKEPMEKIEKTYEANNKNIDIRVNYGASGSLMKQIENGAPCDIFISADTKQVEELSKKKLTEKETEMDFLKNRLVAIVSDNSKMENTESILNTDGKIAIGEPESVPAGKYAKEYLENIDLWNKLQSRFVFAKDVKEVYSWVSTGNAERGFVYYTDTVGKDNIKIIDEADELSEIVYPITVIKGNYSEDVKNLYTYITEDDSSVKVFRECGYTVIE